MLEVAVSQMIRRVLDMLLKIPWQGVNHVITMDLHASQIQGVFPLSKHECIQAPDHARLLQHSG